MLENIVFDLTLENLKYKLKMCGAGTNSHSLSNADLYNL